MTKTYRISNERVEELIYTELTILFRDFHKDSRGYYTVFKKEVRNWIEAQSPDMWEIEERYIYSTSYSFTPEFETLFLLRWSE